MHYNYSQLQDDRYIIRRIALNGNCTRQRLHNLARCSKLMIYPNLKPSWKSEHAVESLTRVLTHANSPT